MCCKVEAGPQILNLLYRYLCHVATPVGDNFILQWILFPTVVCCMTTKAEKPTLQGQRIKTRKRDEKAKYDPVGFRDAILQVSFTENILYRFHSSCSLIAVKYLFFFFFFYVVGICLFKSRCCIHHVDWSKMHEGKISWWAHQWLPYFFHGSCEGLTITHHTRPYKYWNIA